MEVFDLAKFPKENTQESSQCLKMWKKKKHNHLNSSSVHKALLKYSAKSTVVPSGKHNWAGCIWIFLNLK